MESANNEIRVIRCLPDDENWPVFCSVPKLIYDPEHLALSGSFHVPLTNFLLGFVLVKNGVPQARLALYEPQFSTTEPTLCFGAFECINDAVVCNLLFNDAFTFAAGKQVKQVIGPMNGSTWETYRFALNWDHRPFFSEVFQPAYYPQLLLTLDFKLLARYVSHIQEAFHYNQEKVEQLKQTFMEQEVIVRQIDLLNFESEIEKLYPFISASFSGNFLYAPISYSDFRQKYLSQQKWLDPRFVLIAENKNKAIIGLVLAFPDYFDNKKEALVVKTVARDGDKKYAGLVHVMYAQLLDELKAAGYAKAIHAYMHQDNRSVALSDFFSGALLREYVLYQKAITIE